MSPLFVHLAKLGAQLGPVRLALDVAGSGMADILEGPPYRGDVGGPVIAKGESDFQRTFEVRLLA